MIALAAAEASASRRTSTAPMPTARPSMSAAARTCAAYDDAEALARFAQSVDVVTYEFENIPRETADLLARHAPPCIRAPRALATTQDRLSEKDFINRLGIPTAPFRAVDTAGRLRARARRDRPPGGAEDPPLRLRRQGPAHHPHGGRIGPQCDLRRVRRRAADPRRLRGLRARGLGRRRARARRQLRRLRPRARTSTATTSSPSPACRRPASRRRRRRRPSPSRGRSPTRSTMSGCSPSRCSWSARPTAPSASSSTRSRRGCTIPGTGRSRGR